MLDTIRSIFTSDSPAPTNAAETKRVLRMVKNDRMAGYVPKWETVLADTMADQTTITETTNTLQSDNNTATDAEIAANIAPASGNNALAPQPEMQGEGFGFGDIMDMANPLHHIPLVGTAYREITGDTISSVSKTVGGTIYGGAFGLVTGLINAVITEETGKDIETHVKLALSDAPTAPVKSSETEQPPPIAHDLPGTVISLADLKQSTRTDNTPAQSKTREGDIQGAHNPAHNIAQNYPFMPQGDIRDLFRVPDPHLEHIAKNRKSEEQKQSKTDESLDKKQSATQTPQG